jgi:hypothetical protein
VPEGAWAANLLGLSTQVPSKIIYLTDGPNNEVQIGRCGTREIETLRSKLSLQEKRRLLKDTRFGVDWIYHVAKKIAEKTT